MQWSDVRRPYPSLCVHELFERQAAHTPHRIAVAMGEEVWTYAELNGQANRLARRIQSQVPHSAAAIGLSLDRTPKLIAAMLAVLKTGGLYVPIDPDYPADRREFLISDSGVQLLIVDTALPGITDIPTVVLETLAESRLEDSTNLPWRGSPDDLAYILYTSGSTGRPKGVEIPHRGIVRLLFGVDYVSLGPDETFLQMAPVSFDASTFEIWGPLLHGGKCVLYPERIPTPAGIHHQIQRHGVTTMWLTASLFHGIIDQSPESLQGLRQLLAGGETLSPAHVNRALLALPNIRLVNGYGPTESTTFACCHHIAHVDTGELKPIPIGRPIANTTVYILDPSLQPVRTGETGELFIGGDGLARGYRNLPELTNDKFLPDPFLAGPGRRMYRTGDLAKWLPDGTIDFLGRADRQVKIHGFRIELGELEAVIRTVPGVHLAAVVLRETEQGKKQFYAYYEGTATVEDVRKHCKNQLPAHSIPQFILNQPTLPRLESGKIDYSALATQPLESARHGSALPRTETEWIIHRIISNVLAVSEFGINDNFFDLGGDSLSAVRLTTQIAETLGPTLPASVVFEAPSVRTLAERIARTDQGGSAPGLVPLRTGTPGQQPLFCVHGMDGSAWMYKRLVQYLPGTHTVYGLEVREQDLSGSLSIALLAEHHIAQMKQAGFHGPYQLCGFSYGGIVAYEMACQLESNGETVALLAILDSSAYDLRVAWSRSEILMNHLRRSQKLLKALVDGRQSLGAYAVGKLRFLVAQSRTFLSRKQDHVLQWLPSPGEVLTGQRSRFVEFVQPGAVGLLMAAFVRYVPRSYAGTMTLFKPIVRPVTDLDPDNGWRRFMRGAIVVHQVPGDHLSMLDDDANVRTLATEIGRAIAGTGRPVA